MTAIADDSGYPGESLGLPDEGAGSVARFGRRLAALAIDYAASTVIASSFFGFDQFALPSEAGATMFAPMMVFVALNLVFIPTLGGTPGHRLVGLRLMRTDRRWPGLWRPALRTLLIIPVIPPLVWNRDLRGLHDLAAGTVLVRV